VGEWTHCKYPLLLKYEGQKETRAKWPPDRVTHQVTGNDISQIQHPSSNFADASACGTQQKASFNADEQLIVYEPGAGSPLTLQPDFDFTPLNGSNWLCLSHPLPIQQFFRSGSLSVNAKVSVVAQLRGFRVQLQGDGNLVGLDTTGAEWVARWASGKFSAACGTDGSLCELDFGEDGNLVLYDGNGPVWDAGTSGVGVGVVFSNAIPWVAVTGPDGETLWTIADLAE
jgi:hypothetical protein